MIEEPAPTSCVNEVTLTTEKNEISPKQARSSENGRCNDSNERGRLPGSRPDLSKKRRNEELSNDVLVSVRDHFKKPRLQEDRYDLLGKSIAMRLRSLDKRQGLIVEKKINDILFDAEIGMLNAPLYPSYNNPEYSNPTVSSPMSSPASYTSTPYVSPSSNYDQQGTQSTVAGCTSQTSFASTCFSQFDASM